MILIALACMLTFSTTAKAQYDFLRPVKGEIPGGYDFWVYTPTDYYYSLETTPVVMFLHGASLCSKDMNRSRRYGPLDAIVRGRQIDALVIVPQNPGGAWNPDKLNDILEWTKKNYAMDSTRVYKSGLGRLPLWIIHGTGDRAVPVKQSQTVVKQLQDTNNDKRLRFDWLRGASHGALARILYMRKTYEWLFSHSTADPGRPVRPDITIDNSDLKKAYNDMKRGVPSPEIIFEKSIKDDDEY